MTETEIDYVQLLKDADTLGTDSLFTPIYTDIQAAPDSERLEQAFQAAKKLIFQLGETQHVANAKPLGEGMLTEISKRARILKSARLTMISESAAATDQENNNLDAIINNVRYTQNSLRASQS